MPLPEPNLQSDVPGFVSSGVEEVAGQWLLDVLRLPAEASFGFTTGCRTAHFTALAAARDHLLRECRWDVAERGLAGSDPHP